MFDSRNPASFWKSLTTPAGLGRPGPRPFYTKVWHELMGDATVAGAILDLLAYTGDLRPVYSAPVPAAQQTVTWTPQGGTAQLPVG